MLLQSSRFVLALSATVYLELRSRFLALLSLSSLLALLAFFPLLASDRS